MRLSISPYIFTVSHYHGTASYMKKECLGNNTTGGKKRKADEVIYQKEMWELSKYTRLLVFANGKPTVIFQNLQSKLTTVIKLPEQKIICTFFTACLLHAM